MYGPKLHCQIVFLAHRLVGVVIDDADFAALMAIARSGDLMIAGSSTRTVMARRAADLGRRGCVTAGTSHASTEPTWPTTKGKDVTDNTVVWTEYGQFVVAFDATEPSWSSVTFTGRNLVLYKSTGTASTSNLIAFNTLDADKSPSNGTFTFTANSAGWFTFAF